MAWTGLSLACSARVQFVFVFALPGEVLWQQRQKQENRGGRYERDVGEGWSAPIFHDDLWPASAAVRELATVCKTKNGFVFSDLRKFLPNCCDNFVAVVMDVDKTGNEIVVVRDNIKSLPGRGRLSLAMWQAAWDRYALALTMVGRLPFHYAVRYKQVRRFVGAGGAWYVCVLEGDSGGGNGCCV